MQSSPIKSAQDRRRRLIGIPILAATIVFALLSMGDDGHLLARHTVESVVAGSVVWIVQWLDLRRRHSEQ
jgi:hypothetical protein